MKKVLFKQKDIEVVCPEKMVWDEMEVVGEGKRLCEGCDKVLVDVTGYTIEEVHALQRKDPSICVAVTNALLVSSLSFSLLSAGGDIGAVEINTNYDEIVNDMVIVEVGTPVSVAPPIVVALGMPVPPPIIICEEGTERLNLVGFENTMVCIEKGDEE